MTDAGGDGLPVVEPGDLDDRAPVRQGTVAGVVLAAGTGSRFGQENKLLAPLDGQPVIERSVRTVERAALSPVVVVLGHGADRVDAALADHDVETVRNADFADGQATSVATGVEAVRDRADAALVALGDMPCVSADTLEVLLRAYRREVGEVLAAAFEGQRGNPVVFDERYFEALTDITGDVGGREVLLEGDRSALVETGDPNVRRDVDTPADLDALATDR